MTSISAASSSTYQSPLQKLQQELQADVANGTISSDDQDALSSALTDIDSSLQSGRSQAGATSSGDVKSKVDDLISAQVSSGKLTTDQATELKSVFQQAFGGADAAGGGPGGPGGPRGAGGPPPGPPPSGDSSTDSTDSSTDASDVLQQFLDSLKEAQSASASSYGASGASAASTTASSFSALLIDYSS